MELNSKHANMIKREDLIAWMGIVEQKKERLKARYELKSLPERFESQRDYYDIELARARKESKIALEDLERKVHVLNQKISELDVANVNVRGENSLIKIEMEKTGATITSLTNQNAVLEEARQLMQTEYEGLNDQLATTQRDLYAKNDELACARERVHELQQNLTSLIERASDNLSDLPDTVETSSNSQIDLNATVDATVESLECRICCERDKPKSCLPVSFSKFTHSQLQSQCGHILCASCAEQTIRQSCHCPFCRRRVSLGEMVTIFDS